VSDYQSISQWADADREQVMLTDDGPVVMPRRITAEQVQALAREALARHEPAYRRAWILARRWTCAVPLEAKRGALGGWRDPCAAHPEPDDALPPDALVVIHGPVGGGKSSRAARWCLRSPRGVRWEDAQRFDFRRNDDVRATCEWCLAHEGQLVIDDLGKCGEAEAMAIVDVCIARVERRRGTLITSNLTRAEMSKLLGSRFCDRVGHFIEHAGASKRTGADADRFRAEMDAAQSLAETWALPYSAAYRMVRESAADGEASLRQLYVLATHSRTKQGDDVPWLDGRVAALLAAEESET
jgi:hypothetical protein